MAKPGGEQPALTRRVVQLATAAATQRYDSLYALCNDGTVWVCVWGDEPGKEQWMRIVDIPQE